MERPMLVLIKELMKALYTALGEDRLSKLFTPHEGAMLLSPDTEDSIRFSLFKGRLTEMILIYSEMQNIPMLDEINSLSTKEGIAIFNLYFIKKFIPMLVKTDMVNVVYK